MDTPHWRPHLHPYRHVLSIPRFCFSWQLPRASNKKKKKNRQNLQCDRPMKTMTTMIKQCLTRGSHRRPASDSPDNRQLVSCNCRQGSLQSLLPNTPPFPRPHAFLHSCHFCVMNRRLKQLLYARMELQLRQRLSMAWRWGWRLGMGMAMEMCQGWGDSTGCHYE